MTKRNELYRCNICGNIVEVTHPAGGILVCCGKPMESIEGNTQDAAHEKHVPVIEKTDCGYKVSVGSIPHPMTDEHYIEWIELVTPTRIMRKYLKPGEEPTATFMTKENDVTAREYCNLHGLWKSALNNE